MHTVMCARDIGLAVGITFVWALNVIFTKLAMFTLSPIGFNFLRMISVLPLIVFFPLKRVSMKAAVPSALIIGVGHYGLLALGLQLGAGAGITGLLLQLNPFFSTIAEAMILKHKPNKYHLLGFIPALIGIGYGCYYAPNEGVVLGYIYVLISAVCMGIGNVYLKIAVGSHPSSQEVTAFVVAFAPIASPVLLAFMIGIEGAQNAFSNLACAIDGKNLFFICYAGWFSMVWAMKYWTKLLNKYSIASVSPYSLLIPVFSLIMAIFIGENVDQTTLVSVAWIFIALLISQIPSIRKILFDKNSR